MTVMPNKYRAPRKASESLTEEVPLGTLLLAASRQVVLMGSRSMARLPVQPPDSDIVMLIGAMPRQNQADLANRLKMDGTTFGRRVDRLVSMGYVSRETDPDDGRAYLLTLTETGETLSSEIAEIVDDIAAQLSKKMGQRNYKRLSELLALYLSESDGGLSDIL